MKKKPAIKRTIGGTVVGATLAVTAAAFAAVPAHAAAPGVTATSSSPTSTVYAGQKVPTAVTYTLNPTANESLQTGTYFRYWATDNLTTDPVKISYNGTDVTNQFNCVQINDLTGIWGHTAKQVQCDLKAAGFPLTSGTSAQFKVQVDSTVGGAVSAGDTGEIGVVANFVTPSGSTLADSAYIRNAGGTNKNTMTIPTPPGVTGSSSSPTSAVTPGQKVPTAVSYTLNPTASESLQTGTYFRYWATDNLATDPVKITYNGTDVTNQFDCAPTSTLTGIWGHSAPQVQCSLKAAGFPLTAGTPAQFTVQVDSTVSASAPVADTAEIGVVANFVTPSGTTYASSGYIAGAGGTNKNTMTVADVVDTPVIAPAIAGIALLGAAGAGGGIALGRRKKAKANA